MRDRYRPTSQSSAQGLVSVGGRSIAGTHTTSLRPSSDRRTLVLGDNPWCPRSPDVGRPFSPRALNTGPNGTPQPEDGPNDGGSDHGFYSTENWAGWQATAPMLAVSAQWSVPNTTIQTCLSTPFPVAPELCNAREIHACYTWVGLGGDTPTTPLVQGGVASEVFPPLAGGSPTVVTTFWFEWVTFTRNPMGALVRDAVWGSSSPVLLPPIPSMSSTPFSPPILVSPGDLVEVGVQILSPGIPAKVLLSVREIGNP
jgi:hypothetical protein